MSVLLRHSLVYSVARVIPGVINFAALAVFTRLLFPDQYGFFALAVATIGLANVVFMQWLRLGILRYVSSYRDEHVMFHSTVAAAFLCVVAITGIGFWLLATRWPDPKWREYLVVGLLLLWSQAWFEINLELVRSRLSPALYGVLATSKAIIALGIGAVLVYLGFGAKGALMGLFAGFVLPGMWITWREWRCVRLGEFNVGVMRQLLAYGLPLTATFALGFVVNTSDRFFIQWLAGAKETGLYAAGYDLAANTLGMAMTVVNLAAYPLALRALEQEGAGAAIAQVRRGATLLLLVAVPCCVALVLLAPNIASIVLDESYRDAAVRLLPPVVLATLLMGIKSFHCDLAFQFRQCTAMQIWPLLAAAAVNVALNMLWIPRMGILGAAYSTVAAYFVALALSWHLGRRVFPIPFPGEVHKILLAALAMAFSIWPVRDLRGVAALMLQSIVGGATYASVLGLLNVGGGRDKVAAVVRGAIKARTQAC